MKVIGISCSRRKWGNTEILVRQALHGAAGAGAEVGFLRLPDLSLKQCAGCLSCLIKKRDCVQADDFPRVLAALRAADAVVLGTPVYCLFSADCLQTLSARLFSQHYSGELADKTAVALALGGRPGWEGWALAQASLLLRSLGLKVIDQFMGYGQGPGEVLLTPEVCGQAQRAGRALAQGGAEYIGEPGSCPDCHLDLVRVGVNAEAYCPVCGTSGRWAAEGDGPRFVPNPGQTPRWDRAATTRHFEELIISSRDRFLAQKETIAAKLSAFKEQCGQTMGPVDWLEP